MTYDSANRLITYNGEEVKYDADGNMTYGPLDGKMVTYKYDSRNRLVSVGNISYEYDCENNRIALVKGNYREDYVVDTVSSAFSRVLVKRVSDGEDADKNVSADGNKNSETTTLYHYGNGLISQRKGADYSFYHYNHNGSTTALTDLVGNITNTYTYGPYGELLTGDSTVTSYLYNGQYGVQTDPNGLYYMRQRYYNTEIKRFINQDILTGSIDNSQSLNRYCYVQGNPISYTDPFGLSPLGIITQAGHTVLDFIGLCPGIIGAFADSFNCFWYAVEGDTANAILSGVSAIPGLGAFAGAKLAVKGGKYAKVGKKIQKLTSMIGNGATFTRVGEVTLNMGSAMWDKYVIQGEQLSGKTLLEGTLFAFNSYITIASGKEFLSSGNALRKMFREDIDFGGLFKKKIKSSSASIGEQQYPLRLNLQFFASSTEFIKLSKSNIRHIKKHTFDGMSEQAKHLTDEKLAEKLTHTTFFNKNWSQDEVVKYTQEAYNTLRNQGKTGLQSIEINGEIINVFIKDDGTFDTAYGVYKYTVDDFR